MVPRGLTEGLVVVPVARNESSGGYEHHCAGGPEADQANLPRRESSGVLLCENGGVGVENDVDDRVEVADQKRRRGRGGCFLYVDVLKVQANECQPNQSEPGGEGRRVLRRSCGEERQAFCEERRIRTRSGERESFASRASNCPFRAGREKSAGAVVQTRPARNSAFRAGRFARLAREKDVRRKGCSGPRKCSRIARSKPAIPRKALASRAFRAGHSAKLSAGHSVCLAHKARSALVAHD